MSKKFNDAIRTELSQQSVFFLPGKQPVPSDEFSPLPAPQEEHTSSSEKHPAPNEQNDMQASQQASTDASKHASMIASEVDLEGIRKTLKFVGKEVLYVRLTPEEKKRVSSIEYTYQQQGIKTSGNEIGRIGINFLLADYKTNGEHSILAKLLAALHT
jgi:hypothetical protein